MELSLPSSILHPPPPFPYTIAAPLGFAGILLLIELWLLMYVFGSATIAEIEERGCGSRPPNLFLLRRFHMLWLQIEVRSTLL